LGEVLLDLGHRLLDQDCKLGRPAELIRDRSESHRIQANHLGTLVGQGAVFGFKPPYQGGLHFV